MIAGGLLLVDRDKPDAAGARKVIVLGSRYSA